MDKESKQIVLGYDLGDEYSQISYFDEKIGEPVTLSTIAGSQKFQIPTVVCKKTGKDIWYYGKEALYFANLGEGTLVSHLLTQCEKGESIKIEGILYRPEKLLSIFIEKSLTMMGSLGKKEDIKCLAFTMKEVSKESLTVIEKAMEYLKISKERYSVEDYHESFYYYLLNQKKDLWNHHVHLFEYYEDQIVPYEFCFYRKYKPIVARMEQGDALSFTKGQSKEEKDEAFLELIQNRFGDQMISCVFLLGDQFNKEWAVKSLDYMCHNRRVYMGQNLYTKGACYHGRERVTKREIKGFFYDGPNTIHMNVGMNMTIRGNTSYFSMIEAGIHWYEAYYQCEFILDQTKDIILQFDSVDQESKECMLHLDGLPPRPNLADKIELTIYFKDLHTCVIRARDLGLGELYSSSGKSWEAIVEV